MEYNKMTVDELINESINRKDRRIESGNALPSKEAIKAKNAEKAVIAKMGKALK